MPVAFPLVVRTKIVSIHYHMPPGGTQLFFLCLAYLSKHNAFKVHLFCWNCHNFLLSHGWVVFHFVCVCVCVCVCIKNTFFIHLSVVRHLGYFCILVIMNNIAINMRVEISFQYPVFISFRYIARSVVAGSYGSSIFSFFRYFHLKGNQPWIFNGRTDAEAPILWLPDVKSRL